MKTALILIVVAMTLSGCYAGRTRHAKIIGFVASGIFVVGGAIARGSAKSNPPDCTNNGPEPALCDRGLFVPGVLITAGVIGMVINVLVPTKEEKTGPAKPPASPQAALKAPRAQ